LHKVTWLQWHCFSVLDCAFATMLQLLSLKVQSCGELTGACLRYLPALKKVSASYGMDTDDFACLPHLEKLDVTACRLEGRNYFSELLRLKTLTLKRVKLHGDFFSGMHSS
jgi:hypothetical protein